MTITGYLDETVYATEVLLNSIWQDHQRIKELNQQIHAEALIVEREYQAAQWMQTEAEDSDDVMAGVGRHFENYWGPDKVLHEKKEKSNELADLLNTRKYSIANLSGSLLDIAKKGLSTAYGAPNLWPQNHIVAGLPAATIIRVSRNQSTHVDEAIRTGTFKNDEIKTVFDALSNSDPIFADFLIRDMSFEVVQLLGWTDYDSYRNGIINI
ncbi:hypothetical protein [Chitinophaga defluvii]|uniref:Uncharacterized protein n=1 Tax=Chitinophaga defluvii TaxID=3163343 RepID=A0ABV2T6R6_9BACT